MTDTDLTYARYAAVLTALDERAAAASTKPAPLVSLSFQGDDVVAMPWLFCQPVTALLSWADALTGKPSISATRPSPESTHLTLRGKLGGFTVEFPVTTHSTDIKLGSVTVASLRPVAEREGSPDLSKVLDIETIVTPTLDPSTASVR